MSWTLTTGCIRKTHSVQTIVELMPEHEITDETFDQIIAAKGIAIELLKSVPGPYVVINMSGHASGVGWHQSKTSASDFINVGVSQIIEPF